MKVCPTCSLPNPDAAASCSRCGVSLAGVVGQPNEWNPAVPFSAERIARGRLMAAWVQSVSLAVIALILCIWAFESWQAQRAAQDQLQQMQQRFNGLPGFNPSSTGG